MQPTVSTQRTQIGIEGQRGVAVEATKKLSTFAFDLHPEMSFDVFRPLGSKFPTVTILNQNWASAQMDGRQSFNEMLYLLAMIFNQEPTYAAVGVASASWTFVPNDTEPDLPLSLTVEQGSDLIAERVTGLVLTDLTLTYDRKQGVTLQGTGLATSLNVDIDMTDSPTELEPVIITPTMVNVYADTSYENLGTTQLLQVTNLEFKIGNRFAAWWAFNSEAPSFTDIVEQVPTAEMTITMSADQTGWSYLTGAEVGDKYFIQIQVVGPPLPGETGLDYKFIFDMCGEVSSAPDKGNTDDVVTLQFTFTSIYDPSWGKVISAFLQNQMLDTALIPDSALVVEAPEAQIVGIAPDIVAVAGGTAVTIFGYHFGEPGSGNVTSITFGGSAATSFSVVDENTITAVAPAHVAGVGLPVQVVTTNNGTAAGTITYQ